MATKSLFDLTDTFTGLSDNQFRALVDKTARPQLEEVYLKAKDVYYSGAKEIMPDHQFDYLEAALKKLKSNIINKVGGKDSGKDVLVHKHMSPFLSLEKLQVNDEFQFFTNIKQGDENIVHELVEWANGKYPIEASPKFDGNAVELQYNLGKLVKAVSRGEDNMGANITDRLSLIVPTTISSTKNLEIRGEVVMPQNVWKKEYPEKANSRNTVAGILNPKNLNFDTHVRRCVFVAYSIKAHENAQVKHVEDTMSNLTKLGFNLSFPVFLESVKNEHDFRRVYDIFKKYRSDTSVFQLDGIVFKMNEVLRLAIGETKHHPKWAMALKFISVEAITTIKDYDWKVGYTGEFSVTAILEPVDLDGSEVKRASVYNKSKIETNGYFPGAVVSIKKSGDIIPQIVKVLKRSPRENEFLTKQNFFPKKCTCGEPVVIEQENDTVHIWCKNKKCPDVNIMKLTKGVAALKIKDVGESTCGDLYRAGIENIFDLYDPNKMNAQSLINSGVFVKGRTLEIALEAVEQVQKVDLWRVVLCLMFSGLGDTGSKMVAKMINEPDYRDQLKKELSKLAADPKYKASFDGLDKKVIIPFLNDNSIQYQSVLTLVKIMRAKGIDIIDPVKIDPNAMTFEMTGSPSGDGYKTKEELVMFLASKGFAHTKLKDAKLLLTDSHSSPSGKMKDARKKGIKIMTYEELIKTL